RANYVLDILKIVEDIVVVIKSDAGDKIDGDTGIGIYKADIVRPGAAIEEVVALAAGQKVVTGAAIELVVALVPVQKVVTFAAVELIVAFVPEQHVVTFAADQDIAAG